MEVQCGQNAIDEPVKHDHLNFIYFRIYKYLAIRWSALSPLFQDLLYKLQRKIKVFNTSSSLPNRGYNLVASCSKYGIVFVLAPNSVLSGNYHLKYYDCCNSIYNYDLYWHLFSNTCNFYNVQTYKFSKSWSWMVQRLTLTILFYCIKQRRGHRNSPK